MTRKSILKQWIAGAISENTKGSGGAAGGVRGVHSSVIMSAERWNEGTVRRIREGAPL